MEKRFEQGTFNWINLVCPDDRSKHFYAKLFEWDIHTETHEEIEYEYFLLGDKKIAGIVTTSVNHGQWIPYIFADEAATIGERCLHAGAKKHKGLHRMQESYGTLFNDPEGHIFGVWARDDIDGVDLANQNRSYCWNELNAADIDESKPFYTEVFDWDYLDGGLEYPYQYCLVNKKLNAGICGRSANWHLNADTAGWVTFLFTDDCYHMSEKIKKNSGKVLVEPKVVDQFATLGLAEDVCGARFSFITCGQGPYYCGDPHYHRFA